MSPLQERDLQRRVAPLGVAGELSVEKQVLDELSIHYVSCSRLSGTRAWDLGAPVIFGHINCLHGKFSIVQNLLRIRFDGLLIREFLSQHFCGLRFGFRMLQKHCRKLSRTELILQAVQSIRELSRMKSSRNLSGIFLDCVFTFHRGILH